MSDVWPKFVRESVESTLLNDPSQYRAALAVGGMRALENSEVVKYVGDMATDLLSKEEEVEIQGETIAELREQVESLEGEVGILQAMINRA